MSWEQDLNEYAAHTEQPGPTASESAALIRRARAQQRPSRKSIQWGFPVLLAAAAAWLLFAQTSSVDVKTTQPVAKAPTPAASVPTYSLSPGRQVLGEDVIEVAQAAQVHIIEQGANTRLALTSGEARFQVAKRQDGEHFVVESEAWQIEVIGTAFSVQHSPFLVQVFEGIVAVKRGDKSWRLIAGDRFEEGTRIRPKPKMPVIPALPSLASIRQTIIGGDLDQARATLGIRLTQNPSDFESHTLLAQLETRAGNTSTAIDHWTQVISTGGPNQAQRAHYEIALLSTDQPARAERHLRAFLQHPSPLTADARLRLASALLSQDRQPEATTELNKLIQSHPGSTPARKAQTLLDSF
jgi:tetratricopeptide (TPR) repeat protein